MRLLLGAVAWTAGHRARQLAGRAARIPRDVLIDVAAQVTYALMASALLALLGVAATRGQA
jgi:hypothetical protein